MNDPTQDDFNDELLSAYLDDELTPSERALVEARLESDPVARQTLEHLRNVSQSVHNLPTASPNRDLHAAILRRIAATPASRAVPGPAQNATTTCSASVTNQPSPKSTDTSPTPLPTLTIGRTTRAWVWACAAVAAALLIMFLQPNRDENAGLPNVAMNAEPRSGGSAVSREIHPPGSVDKRLPEQSLDEGKPAADDFGPEEIPAIAAAQDEPRVPPAPAAGELSESVAAPPASPPESARVDNRPAASSLSDGPAISRGQEMAALAAPTDGAEPLGATATVPAKVGRAAPASQPATHPIVVHVLASRAAIENKTFDELLRNNGILLESAELEDKDKQLAFGVEAEKKRLARSERQSAAEPAGAPAEPTGGLEPETEAVLVDAPATTLVSCMNALNSDAENYPGIAVLKDQPHSSSESSGVEDESTREGKEVVSELSKFSRGVVPPADVKLGADMYHFYAVPQSVERGQIAADNSEPRGAGGAYGGGKIDPAIASDGSPTDRGRARRIAPRFVEQAPTTRRSLNFDFETMKAAPLDANPQALGAPIAANENDRLQVLFIIHPNDATAAATVTTPAPTLKAKLPADQPSPE